MSMSKQLSTMTLRTDMLTTLCTTNCHWSIPSEKCHSAALGVRRSLSWNGTRLLETQQKHYHDSALPDVRKCLFCFLRSRRRRLLEQLQVNLCHRWPVESAWYINPGLSIVFEHFQPLTSHTLTSPLSWTLQKEYDCVS